jgi:4-hydroxybenzoate polyprenyltransferase
MSKWLSNMAHFIRWRDWGPGKIPVLCTVLLYGGLANRQVSAAFIRDFVLFIFFAALHSAMGYVVNDWGDRELDVLHGEAETPYFSHRAQDLQRWQVCCFWRAVGVPLSGAPGVPSVDGWAFSPWLILCDPCDEGAGCVGDY